MFYFSVLRKKGRVMMMMISIIIIVPPCAIGRRKMLTAVSTVFILLARLARARMSVVVL